MQENQLTLQAQRFFFKSSAIDDLTNGSGGKTVRGFIVTVGQDPTTGESVAIVNAYYEDPRTQQRSESTIVKPGCPYPPECINKINCLPELLDKIQKLEDNLI